MESAGLELQQVDSTSNVLKSPFKHPHPGTEYLLETGGKGRQSTGRKIEGGQTEEGNMKNKRMSG